MKIIIHVNGKNLSVEVSEAVYLLLDENRRIEENMHHEKRRHWDTREFSEQIIVRESSYQCYETPEQWYLRKELLTAIQTALASCTKTQRERFLLHSLDGLSFADIARLQGCSKYAVRDSVEAARKKIQTFLKNRPHESHF